MNEVNPYEEAGNGNKPHYEQHCRREYFWVCAVEKATGRPVIQGPHNTEDDARQWGFEHIKDGDFEVVPIRTINKIAARDHYKNIMLERTKTLSSVFPRAKYKI